MLHRGVDSRIGNDAGALELLGERQYQLVDSRSTRAKCGIDGGHDAQRRGAVRVSRELADRAQERISHARGGKRTLGRCGATRFLKR
jgi:hypothetical protein